MNNKNRWAEKYRRLAGMKDRLEMGRIHDELAILVLEVLIMLLEDKMNE